MLAPGFVLFILFGLGVYFGINIDFSYEIPGLIIAFSIIIGLIINKKYGFISLIFIGVSIILTGALWSKLRVDYFPEHHIINKVTVTEKHETVKAIIYDSWVNKKYFCSSCSLKTEKGFIPITGNFLLTIPRTVNDSFSVNPNGDVINNELKYGDMLCLTGVFEIIRSPSNYYVYDQTQKYLEKGVRLELKLDDNDTLLVIGEKKGNPIMQKIIIPLREKIDIAVSDNFSGVYKGMVKGILMGEKDDIPYETRQQFSKAGISHILAVSGLHMAILGSVLFILFGVLFRGNYKMAVFPSIIASLIYMLLAGAEPSSIRASIMMSIFLVALFRGKNMNSFHTLGLAGFLILLWNPMELVNAGFQLSFGAVWGILLIYPLINKFFSKVFGFKSKKVNRLVAPAYSLFSVSTSAQFGTAAFVALVFFRFQIVGPFVNMIVVPVISPALPLSLLSVLFYYIFEPLSKIFAGATWLSIHIVMVTSRFAAGLPFAAPFIKIPSLGMIIGYYIFLSLVVDIITKTKTAWISKKILVALLIVYSAFYIKNKYEKQPVELVMFDTYGGNAFMIHKKGTDAIAFNNCNTNDWTRNVIPYINACGSDDIRKVFRLEKQNYDFKKTLTFEDFTITINRYGWVKMISDLYTINLIPQTNGNFVLNVKGTTNDIPIDFSVYPRGNYPIDTGTNFEIKNTGSVRLRIFNNKIELQSKRLGKLAEWRKGERNKRFI